MTKRVFSSSYKVKRPKGDVIMKKLFVLFIAFLVSALSACNEEAVSVSSENAQHEESSVAVNESSTVSEESRELTLEEKFPDHNISSIQKDRCLAVRKGQSDSDRENYIINGDGEIIKAFNCDRIVTISGNKSLLYVVMTDGSAFFINTDGERTDDVLWDSLIPWEKIYEGDFLGRRGEEYYVLNSNGETVMQISTEPELYGEYDGLTIVSAFIIDDWYYGVMKDGEFIIEPQFWDMPIIKKGSIIVNSNSVDILSSKGYIYDYSGNLVKTVCGYFEAHEDFDYIIERELKDEFTEDAIYSILDYSFEKLYTAPMGVSIGLAYQSMWSPEIMPYHVEVNGVIVHLENLIDGIEYPKVEVPDYKNAVGLNPERATVIQTPYQLRNTGRNYEFTDELKSYLKSKLINYLTVADVPFDESKIIFEEDEQDCYASYKLDGNSRVTACWDYILLKTATEDISREPMTDPFTNPAVLDFCEMTFKTTEGLKVERTSDAYIIYNGSDSVDRGILSLAQKYVRVTVDYEHGFFKYVSAKDLSDENIFPTHTLDALSYAEAEQRFRNGKFVQMTYDLTEIDHENCNIEGVEFVYELITDCCCEECFDIGYYIPCYNFIIRDKDSPEYVGDFLVPAIDLNELNDYLASKSLPRVNHYWTKN